MLLGTDKPQPSIMKRSMRVAEPQHRPNPRTRQSPPEQRFHKQSEILAQPSALDDAAQSANLCGARGRAPNVLTDNGMAFAVLPKHRTGPTAMMRGHPFDRACWELGVEHRLTKPYHPWTNGQAERMNRTIKDATVKVFHYDDLESLKAHVLAFITAHNFAKHLKALRWRTPYQAICDAWTKDPSVFKINPRHLIPGPHN
jgi:hypothetical protein